MDEGDVGPDAIDFELDGDVSAVGKVRRNIEDDPGADGTGQSLTASAIPPVVRLTFAGTGMGFSTQKFAPEQTPNVVDLAGV